MVGMGIVFVTVTVRQHVAKPVTQATGKRGDAVIQVRSVWRRMVKRDVKMAGYVIARIDATRKPAGRDQRKRRRDRMNRNRNWYRNRHWHRLFHRDRIRLMHWHHDRFLHCNRHRLCVWKIISDRSKYAIWTIAFLIKKSFILYF